jgi:predicted secreted acid phosphatase
MKRFLILFFSFLIMPCILANPVLNVSQEEEKIILYRLSGQYLKEITAITDEAARYLILVYRQNQLATPPQKLAIVFDIDETALSNYKGFYSAPAQQTPLMKPAIAPVRNLYRIALQHHVAVFFVTGRRESTRAALTANLKQAGYYKWKKLYMRPDEDHNASVVPYKTGARKKITTAGYSIVFTMGDQEADLEGSNTGQTYKLPNPFYYTN